jgi:MerR family copper efflux transcriptional regulator
VPAELRIACSLGAGELEARRAQMAALGREALRSARVDGARAELRFAARAGVGDRVRAIAGAERRCCPFLTLRVREGDGEIVLAIDAPPDVAPVLGEFTAAFGPA